MTKLKELLNVIQSRHVYIQTHNFPDPDAISSAFGLSVLLKRYGIDSSICYKGEIERYSTNGFVQKLGIELTNMDSLEHINDEEEIILVDAQKGNSNIGEVAGHRIICIDHHPTFTDSDYCFADIRPDMGACATIIATYFFDNFIPMDKRVATALFYGIKTDTMGLSRGVNITDIDAYRKLYGMIDYDIIRSLEHCSIKFDDLKAYSNAINSIKVFGRVGFANTGKNCPEALIANISDFMLDLVEVDFSVVYSIKEDGIKLSVRSSCELDSGKITNTALEGIGCGGGHAFMAGGFVCFDSRFSEEELIEDIEGRFLKTINKTSGGIIY
ncbi:MAG: bifunctional oligoribonuclease/PAP phosphatase NrnA [Butyrivibrio sp.]